MVVLVRPRRGPTPASGRCTTPGPHAQDKIPVPPSTQYYGRIYGCFSRRPPRPALAGTRCGEDNICFETDYPHTDTTWPYSEAYIEKLCVGLTDEQAYKILRGNAIKMLELDRV